MVESLVVIFSFIQVFVLFVMLLPVVWSWLYESHIYLHRISTYLFIFSFSLSLFSFSAITFLIDIHCYHTCMNHMAKLTKFLCTLPLTALRYVMYFWFCGWCHVFIPWVRQARIMHNVMFRRNSPGGGTSWTSRQLQCLTTLIRMRHWWQSLLSRINLYYENCCCSMVGLHLLHVLLMIGDPSRFHSFYIAVCVEDSKPLAFLDLLCLSRLGTNVKKTTLLCSVDREGQVRCTSLQWSGIGWPSARIAGRSVGGVEPP